MSKRMRFSRIKKRSMAATVWAVVAALHLFLGVDVHAHPKSQGLIEQLHLEKSYLARSRAAYTLGDYPSGETQNALLGAIEDPHEAVRIAAISSLAKVGDRSVIPVLRRVDEPNWQVREQIRSSLIFLEERFPGAKIPINWKHVRTAVEIGPFSDGSSIEQADFGSALRRYVSRYLKMRDGIAVLDRAEGLNDVSDEIETRKINPIFVTGRLVSLIKKQSQPDVVWEAVVLVTVLDHPNRSIRAMVNSRAISTHSAKTYTPKFDSDLQDKAIDKSIRSAVDKIVGVLNNM